EDDIKLLNKDGEKMLDDDCRKRIISDQKLIVKKYWEKVYKLLTAVQDGVSSKELGVAYDNYSLVLRRVYAHFITSTEHVTFAIESELKSLLRKNFPNNLDEVYAVLTTPVEKDLLIKEKEAWLNLLDDISDENILNYYKNYSIILANVFSKEEVHDIANQRIKTHTPDNIREELICYEKRKTDLIKRKKELFSDLVSDRIGDYSNFICKLANLRLELKHCWNGESFHLLPFFEKIAALENCSVRDAYMFYTRKDISVLLNKNVSLSKKILEARNEFCLLRFHKSKIDIYNGEDAIAAKEKFLNLDFTDDVKSFKGSIANKGKIVGRARVVLFDNPQKIYAFAKTLEKDDILVAGMTNPTMMVLISKVKGIITDEGGAACHAAIISREFNIPCVVGTKIATHVLKDGDMIELNANSGVITKL
ncbi:MAG: hypothetical protein KKF65_01275, partial [Nanoarchaeota archaeon]|nr:hypothetical protein [Nanoarchaeota archaeon]